MHRQLWFSLLLALFLTVSGCAKNEESSTQGSSTAADSVSPSADSKNTPAVVQPEPAPVQESSKTLPEKNVQAEQIAPAEKKSETAASESADILQDSPSPAKTGPRGELDSKELHSNKAKADRKEESGAAEQQPAKAGDDMERMD